MKTSERTACLEGGVHVAGVAEVLQARAVLRHAARVLLVLRQVLHELRRGCWRNRNHVYSQGERNVAGSHRGKATEQRGARSVSTGSRCGQRSWNHIMNRIDRKRSKLWEWRSQGLLGVLRHLLAVKGAAATGLSSGAGQRLNKTCRRCHLFVNCDPDYCPGLHTTVNRMSMMSRTYRSGSQPMPILHLHGEYHRVSLR